MLYSVESYREFWRETILVAGVSKQSDTRIKNSGIHLEELVTRFGAR